MSKRIAPPVGAGDDELDADADPFFEEALELVPVDLQRIIRNYEENDVI
jgi:hypothetical protein